MKGLFSRQQEFETEILNSLRRLPLGECYSFNALTTWLGRARYTPGLDGETFIKAVNALAGSGHLKPIQMRCGDWTVPGFVNRAGYFVETPRKRRK